MNMTEPLTDAVGRTDFDAADRLAITNLLHSYGFFLDEQQPERFVALFVEQPVVEVRAGTRLMMEGWDAWRDTILQRQAEFGELGVQRRHVLTGIRFDRQDADSARGDAYCLLYSASGGETGLVTSGRYEFTVQRVGDEWKIARWIAHVDGAMDGPDQHR